MKSNSYKSLIISAEGDATVDTVRQKSSTGNFLFACARQFGYFTFFNTPDTKESLATEMFAPTAVASLSEFQLNFKYSKHTRPNMPRTFATPVYLQTLYDDIKIFFLIN